MPPEAKPAVAEASTAGSDLRRGLTLSRLSRELGAGLSVSAVSVPAGLACAALVGVTPVTGLYASLAPMAAYALFGRSRYLIVGPDTATCLLTGAAITALGVQDPGGRAMLAEALALMVGIGFAIAAVLRLGFVANLLSGPILVGYMGGIALTLLVSQIGSFTGVAVAAPGLVRPLIEILRRSDEIQPATLALGIALFAALRGLKAFAPKAPGPAIVVAAAVALSFGLDLPATGVAVIGAVPAGLPAFHVPALGQHAERLLPSIAGLLIVSFSSGILTARSFGRRLRERGDPNLELRGFAAADLAAGLFQGFPVTGADSRTAVALAAGGRTRAVGLIGALGVALVLTLLTGALAYLPKAALAAVLASAAFDLVDLRAFARLWRIDRFEFAFAAIAAAGVLWIGVLQGVFLAVGFTFAHLLRLTLWPRCRRLGLSKDAELVSLAREPDAEAPAEGVIFRFEASLLFMNADYFLQEALAALDASPGARWFILDASSTPMGDSTGVDALLDLKRTLDGRAVRLLIGGAQGLFREVADKGGLLARLGPDGFYPSAQAALAAAGGGRLHAPALEREET